MTATRQGFHRIRSSAPLPRAESAAPWTRFCPRGLLSRPARSGCPRSRRRAVFWLSHPGSLPAGQGWIRRCEFSFLAVPDFTCSYLRTFLLRISPLQAPSKGLATICRPFSLSRSLILFHSLGTEGFLSLCTQRVMHASSYCPPRLQGHIRVPGSSTVRGDVQEVCQDLSGKQRLQHSCHGLVLLRPHFTSQECPEIQRC